MKKPLVTVVIPAYNCEAFIEKAINSILKQTYSNLEILISDDGSHDKTRRLIDGFKDSRIKTFHNQQNIGNIRTRNSLFKAALGDYITIQDADDWSHPERIEKQVEAFFEDSELGACGTNYTIVNWDGTFSTVQQLKEDAYVKSNIELFFWPPSIMIRRKVYENIGGLNLYFERLFAEDKYWIALILEKFKILCLKDALYYYRFNPNSLTKTMDEPRKLLVTKIIDELLKQRSEKGTDLLEQEEFEKLASFEIKLFSDKKWLSERYRIFSAVSIDSLRFKDAIIFLWKSFLLNPFNGLQFLTLFYLLRKWGMWKINRWRKYFI